MAETLSAQERTDAAEEAEYYNEQHPAKTHKKGYDGADDGDTYEEGRRAHAKQQERKSEKVSSTERAEMAEDVDYYEKTHQVRGKTENRRTGPEDHPESRQPGHGGTKFLSPFEVSEYKEELEYREKQHGAKKSSKSHEPLSTSEILGYEDAYLGGKKGKGKALPEGMFGYDVEADYFHNVSQKDNRRVNPRGSTTSPLGGAPFMGPIGPQKSRGRRVTDAIRSGWDFGIEARDKIYGYRRIYDNPETSNAWHLDRKSVSRNKIGTFNMFNDRGGGRMMSMNPFGVGGRSPAPRKGKRGKKSLGEDPYGIPPSLAWMF
jgi:hypothetical protein